MRIWDADQYMLLHSLRSKLASALAGSDYEVLLEMLFEKAKREIGRAHV